MSEKMQTRPLSEMVVIHNGIDYKKNPKGDAEIPIYGTGGIIGYTSIFLNEGPAILTGRKGSINRPFYLEGKFWNVDTIFCLKPIGDNNAKWLYYSILNVDMTKLNEATGVPSITSKSLYRLHINYFNPDKQQKIAQILTTFDTVIERSHSAIAKYKSIKQGMLHDLFTRGLDSNGKLRPTFDAAPELYKSSELGMIPKEWEVKRLEEISTMKSGDGITSLFINNAGDYPVYGGNGLRGFTSSYTHNGDYVLIGRQGALCGNITRVSNKFFASEHAVVVSVNKDIDVDWLSQKLEDMNLNQYSEASAQPGLAVAKILRLYIVLPQYIEQKGIGKRLLAIDNKMNAEEILLQKYQSVKRGLMGDLLGGGILL